MVVKTPMYKVWLAWGHDSNSIATMTSAEVKTLKENVQRAQRQATVLARSEQLQAQARPAAHGRQDEQGQGYRYGNWVSRLRRRRETPSAKLVDNYAGNGRPEDVENGGIRETTSPRRHAATT